MSRQDGAPTRARLRNGLRVLVIPDRSTPIVAVAVVYDVGFRSEPEGRTGFAHLFEHLMFQGSANVGKVEHIQAVESAGGVMNGHTQSDVTAYYEALPAGGLELALWLEADRMGALAVTQDNLDNQIAVVQEEIKVNVLNRPYGGFPWIPMPQLAFDTFANSHNGYGSFVDLQSATLADAADFYATYYSPRNACLTIGGAVDPDHALDLAERHLGRIPPRPAPRIGPFTEAPLSADRHQRIDDPHIPMPALALAHRVPDPVADPAALASHHILNRILADGDASRLRSKLVHGTGQVTDLGAHIGYFGSDSLQMRDPMLTTITAFYPPTTSPEAILDAVLAELDDLSSKGPAEDELTAAVTAGVAAHHRSNDALLGRTLAHASTEVIHGRAELVTDIPTLLENVDADAIQRAATDLRSQHHACLELIPAGAQ